MGKRYQAILKHLKKDFKCFDIDSTHYEIVDWCENSEGIILATPTETHVDYLLLLEKCKKPVLCEKPLSMYKSDLEEIKWACQRGLNLTMQMQYKYFDNKECNGPSEYNYFRHGNDGLSWDCLQIIGLARGEVSLKEDSPKWICKLNGLDLDLSQMDDAYIWSVKNWLEKPGDDINSLLEIHQKVAKYEEEYGARD